MPRCRRLGGGHGGLLLVSGEAGIGKTSLVRDASQFAEALGMRVGSGSCYDLSTAPPYGPWLEALQDLCDPGASLPFAASRYSTAPTNASQEGLFQRTRGLLHGGAGEDGLLIVLDDAHWADQASLDLLRFFSHRLKRAPIALIVSYRLDELSRRHPLSALIPTLIRAARAERLELKPLNERSMREWVAAVYSLANSDEDRLVAYLVNNAEGNPFFASEILRSVEEDGLLVPAIGGWTTRPLWPSPCCCSSSSTSA